MNKGGPAAIEPDSQRCSGAMLVAQVTNATPMLADRERRLISISRAMSADAKYDVICTSTAVVRSSPAAPVRQTLAHSGATST